MLVKELKIDNKERIAFEAAWLAHALVDGLTPAHHYPYEAKLTELRGEGIETRTTWKEKLIISADTKSEQVKKNWKVWGPKGLISTHHFFELGIASMIKPLSFNDAVPSEEDIEKMLEIGPIEWFKRTAREIAVLDIYERYYKRGWSTKVTLDVRNKLIPSIIKTVTLTWYAALDDAKLIDKS